MGSCGCDALYRSGTLAGLTSALSTSSYGPSNGNAIDFDNNNDNNKNNYNYNDYTLDGNYTNDNNDNVAPKQANLLLEGKILLQLASFVVIYTPTRKMAWAQ